MAKKKDRPPLIILIIVYGALLFFIFNSLFTLVLGLWGQPVMGTVDSYHSRLGNVHAGENRSRTVSEGYYFSLGARDYRGYVIYLSDEAWPGLSQGQVLREIIYYLPIFPYINKPASLADFDQLGALGVFYHLLGIAMAVFLIWLVAGSSQEEKEERRRRRSLEEDLRPNFTMRGGSDMKEFRSLLEASKEAARFSKAWNFAHADEKHDEESLLLLAQVHDESFPLDEGNIYLVDSGGAIGLGFEEGTIDWLFIPPAVFLNDLPKTWGLTDQK